MPGFAVANQRIMEDIKFDFACAIDSDLAYDLSVSLVPICLSHVWQFNMDYSHDTQ